MKEKQIIKENIRQLKIEEYLSKEFTRAGYSHAEIQRTPLALRIMVYAQKPGMVIGRGGKTIEAITNVLKDRFGLENPQLDVQEVEDPDLDPFIVSKQIASALERGLNYKRVANLTLERVMSSGAVGIALRIAGKLGGDISRTEKFSSGYLKYAGNTAETMVKLAYAEAHMKLGLIGIQVRIMTEPPKELELEKRIRAEKIPEKPKPVEHPVLTPEPLPEAPVEKTEETPAEEPAEPSIEETTEEE